MGVVKSSEAMTPESLATTRSGMFSRASAPISARQVVSYDAATCSRSGGGESGATSGRRHPAASPSTKVPARMPRLTLVMVDPPIGLDEPDDPRFVELVEGVNPRPRRRPPGPRRRPRPTRSGAEPCAGLPACQADSLSPCLSPGLSGGSVWESNPPPACLEPDAGFEVREAHRDPRRFL